MTDQEMTDVKLNYRDRVIELSLPNDANVGNLALQCADEIEAEVERISILILPKPGLLKYPFPKQKISEIITPRSRLKLIGTPTTDVKKLDEMASRAAARTAARQNLRGARSTKNRDWKQIQEESMYTFHTIEPLTYLPNPEKSKRFLERLANDPGIKASMRKHKFSVGLLTEMNPAEHTTHESRTLGLNRNRGEVIELRLRTDRYDGYRDYKVIRKTLCHELSHNVWGEHDRNFWDLTKQIEKEVEKNDYHHGGHRLTENEFHNPNDDGDGIDHADGGGWMGGEFVLGRSEGSDVSSEVGLTRREIIARATLSRLEKQKSVPQEPNEHDPQQHETKGDRA